MTVADQARQAVLADLTHFAERCEQRAATSVSDEVKEGLLAKAEEWRRVRALAEGTS
jgi:hypothetical protein